MTDLLSDLLTVDAPTPGATTLNPAELPLRVVADWFFTDCKARNLQPKTVHFYQLKLSYLLEAAGDWKVKDITTAHLRLLVNHYHEKRKWSVGTTNHAITTWKVFFGFLEQEEYLRENPARRLEKMKGARYLPEPFSIGDLQRLLAATGTGLCGARDTVMYLLLLDTGIRLGELMGLCLDDVDMALGQIRVFGKGRKERLVPFSPPVRRALMKYLALRETVTHGEDELWVSEGGLPFTKDGFNTQLRRVAKRAKVQHAHAHRFRHTMATMYLQQGGHSAHLQRLLGHTTPTMTNRYVHLADIDARDDHQTASPATHLLKPRKRA